MNVTALRKAAGLSQQELAAAAGITQSEVSRIERGLVEPERKTARAINKALGVTGTAKPAERRAVVVGEEIFAAFDVRGQPIPGRSIGRRTFDRALGDQVRDDDGFGLGIPEETIRAEREYWERVRGQTADAVQPICTTGIAPRTEPLKSHARAPESGNRPAKDTTPSLFDQETAPVALGVGR
jgi:transcriptional regulator with XRE-family HTH domain